MEFSTLRRRMSPRAFLLGLVYRYMPRLVEMHLNAATAGARAKLIKSGPLLILIDNNVLSNGITHETLWIRTATGGHMARVPVHGPKSPHRERRDLTYLTGLTHLARQGHILFKTSAELKAEQEFHAPEVFRDVGWFDFNLFSGLRIQSVDGSHFRTFGPSWLIPPSDPKVMQRERLDGSDDTLFHGLVAALGKRNDQDAWHLRTAEVHGCHCFLTMDYALMRNFEAQKGNRTVKRLKTKPMTPECLGKELGLKPVDPAALSFNDVSWFVYPGIGMPGDRRRVHLPPD